MKLQKISSLLVRRAPLGAVHDGLLSTGIHTYPCKLGRTGITTRKVEGDGATPAGRHRIIGGFFRTDRLFPLKSAIYLAPTNAELGWCDDPKHSQYNRPVKLPFDASHETMFRKDSLYDVCFVLDYNYFQRKKYAGSAIFLHLANPSGKATEGCIGLEKAVMLKLLPHLSPNTVISIIA